MENNESLDTSWFQEYNKLLNLQTNFNKEKMINIDVKFIYIDNNDNIVLFDTKKIILTIGQSELKKIKYINSKISKLLPFCPIHLKTCP